MKKIFVSQPFLGQAETDAVNVALSRREISGFSGDFIGKFESMFATYCDCTSGVTVSNGTTALHLALVALGIKQGDEVLVSTLTNMATFFAVLYQGAIPVPIDVEVDTEFGGAWKTKSAWRLGQCQKVARFVTNANHTKT